MSNKNPKPAKVINAPHKQELEAKKREIAEAEQKELAENAQKFKAELTELSAKYDALGLVLVATPTLVPAQGGFLNGAEIRILQKQ